MERDPEKEDWFETHVRNLEGAAFRYALWLVGDKFAAEEVLQEALTRTWKSANTPREPAAFKRWLYRAMTNIARDEIRRRRVLAALRLAPAPPADPLEEVERRLGEAGLAEALRLLPRRERTAVYLRFLEDSSFADIAAVIGTTEGNARVIVHRALQKLRQTLGTPLTEARV